MYSNFRRVACNSMPPQPYEFHTMYCYDNSKCSPIITEHLNHGSGIDLYGEFPTIKNLQVTQTVVSYNLSICDKMFDEYECYGFKCFLCICGLRVPTEIYHSGHVNNHSRFLLNYYWQDPITNYYRAQKVIKCSRKDITRRMVLLNDAFPNFNLELDSHHITFEINDDFQYLIDMFDNATLDAFIQYSNKIGYTRQILNKDIERSYMPKKERVRCSFDIPETSVSFGISYRKEFIDFITSKHRQRMLLNGGLKRLSDIKMYFT